MLMTPSRAPRKPMSRFAAYILVGLGALTMLLPFYFMFVFATHSVSEIFRLPPPLWFGDKFSANYESLMSTLPFWRNLWNSLYIALVSTVAVLFFCSLAGYAFAMYNFKWREQLFAVLMGTMLIPATLNLIPFFVVASLLGWVGKPVALWLPGAANAFGIFLMRQYIGSAIPKELLDAARIDGATEFQIFYRIVLPLVRPALGTLGLITFISNWNSFLTPLIILTDPDTLTAPLALRTLQSGRGSDDWGVIMTGTVIAVLPLMVVFVFASRQIIEGLTQGSTKG
jgi:multiple sugar transport system permease protein